MRCFERGRQTMMTFGTPRHQMVLQSVVQWRHHAKLQMKQFDLILLFPTDQSLKITHGFLQIIPHLVDLHTSLVLVHGFFQITLSHGSQKNDFYFLTLFIYIKTSPYMVTTTCHWSDFLQVKVLHHVFNGRGTKVHCPFLS